MPIRPEFRKFYGRIWRTVIRPLILERAGNKCEHCGVANYERGVRIGSTFLPMPVPNRLRGGRKVIRIVLQVAHRNHISGDDRPENLAAFCPRCHFLHDLKQHHETRAARKDRARPLLLGGGQ